MRMHTQAPPRILATRKHLPKVQGLGVGSQAAGSRKASFVKRDSPCTLPHLPETLRFFLRGQ